MSNSDAQIKGRDGDIYSALADGSNPTRLARGTEPAWSADRRIAFTGVDGVYVMNENGSNVRLVVLGGSMPAWSPDARRLAFAKSFDGFQTIADVTVDVTVDASMASPVRVGFDRAYHVWLARDARWAPIRDDPRFATLTERVGLPH